jgi:NAD+ diphosphatase
MTLAFVNSPLDRCGNLRSDSVAITQLRVEQTSLTIQMAGDSVLFQNNAPHFLSGAVDNTILLGRDENNVHWFAKSVAPSDDLDFRHLRALASDGVLSAPVLSIMAQARSLLHWHERHGFCANCGAATVMADAGYRRHCDVCSADHFPRTDPVIIIAVRHGDNFLLGRQAAWTPGMYSTLAGFMEPGETIEQAARREVFEESGIKVGAISYVMCQPWPFPTNLMIGLIGDALNTDITIDPKELETARWFSRAEVRTMLDRTHPDGLTATHPIAIAYHILEAALKA